MRHILYAVFTVMFMPGLLKAESETFHTAFWANEAHRDQRNGIINMALKEPALYGYHKDNTTRTVLHKVCEENECATLKFRYQYDEGVLSSLHIVLYDTDERILWKRQTSFYDHDTKGASRSWPLESVEVLYDDSQKETEYECSLGYGECMIKDKYQLKASNTKVPGVPWLFKEKKRWEQEAQRYGSKHTLQVIDDIDRVDGISEGGIVRLDGQLMKDGLYRFYNNGMSFVVQLVQSRVEGKIYGYSISGTLMAEGNFLHGKEEGKQFEYYESGLKQKEEFYHQGKKEGEQYTFYADGSIWHYSSYSNGKRHGKQIDYYTDGQKSYEVTFDKGKKEGQECRYYHENGNPRVCETFHKGKRHGKFQRYYEDGSLHWEMTFIEDVLNGGASEYYPNGQLRSKVLYIDGLRQGIMTYFDKEGIVRLEERFCDGILVERFIILPNGMKQLVPIH